MNNNQEIREIKQNLNTFVASLERLKKLFGQEMEAYSFLKGNTPVVNAFHKVQICTDQNINALLELDMVLQDVLDGRIGQ